MKIDIRPAHPGEAPLLTTMAHAAKRHWGYPDHWVAAWQDHLTLSPEAIEHYKVYVAVVKGEPAGFYALDVHEDLCTMEHLWVLPGMMGRSVGRALFEHAVRVAAHTPAEIVQIDSDPYAEGFYVRMGARRVGEIRADVDGQARVLPRLEFRLRPT